MIAHGGLDRTRRPTNIRARVLERDRDEFKEEVAANTQVRLCSDPPETKALQVEALEHDDMLAQTEQIWRLRNAHLHMAAQLNLDIDCFKAPL